MHDPTDVVNPHIGTDPDETDSRKQEIGFGDGGIPWYLLLIYLSFLVFFTWYVLEFQLPDFVDQGPVSIEEGAAGR